MQNFRGVHLLHKPSFLFEVGKAIADVCGLLSSDQPVFTFNSPLTLKGWNGMFTIYLLFFHVHFAHSLHHGTALLGNCLFSLNRIDGVRQSCVWPPKLGSTGLYFQFSFDFEGLKWYVYHLLCILSCTFRSFLISRHQVTRKLPLLIEWNWRRQAGLCLTL